MHAARLAPPPIPLVQAINQRLDRLATPRIRVAGHPRSAFRVWGYSGFAAAVVLSQVLTLARGLNPAIMLLITVGSMATFYAIALLTKALTGYEQLTFYHHFLGVLLTASALLALVGAPVLAYLDIIALGLMVFDMVGRFGCLMAGCCHGRPARWGICYPAHYHTTGLPAHLVGVRLLPVPVLEALLAACIALSGSLWVLGGAQPGPGFVWAITGYAAARFALEFLRGDPARPYVYALSEAQWTSLVVVTLASAGALAGYLPLTGIALLTGGLLWLTALIVMQHAGQGMLTTPRHVSEVLRAITRSAAAPGLEAHSTPLGVQITARRTPDAAHYALSRPAAPLTEPDAHALARLIARLRHKDHAYTLVTGQSGVFHVLIAYQTPAAGEREGLRRDV